MPTPKRRITRDDGTFVDLTDLYLVLLDDLLEPLDSDGLEQSPSDLWEREIEESQYDDD